jgi:transposase
VNDTALYQQLLGLASPWRVQSVALKINEQEVAVAVAYDPATTWACPECAQAMGIHDHVERRWRHLDSCQFKTMVRARVPRVRCSAHGLVTVRVPWAEERGRFTKLFERLAIDVLKECSVSGACELLRISWDEAQGILQRAVKRGLARKQQQPLRYLAIDEKSFRKGHDYVTLVVNLEGAGESATVEYVGEGRDEQSLEEFWQGLDETRRAAIEAVALDLWQAYQNSVRAHLPEAEQKIVQDRFHLMQHMVEAVDKVRKQEHRELLQEGFDLLTGTKYWWLHGRENLPPKHRAEFAIVRGANLKVGRAWSIKETLRRLWDYRYLGAAEKFFGRWYGWAVRSRLEPVKKVARMFKRHLKNILTFLAHRITTAAAEGLNGKIQEVKKRAYGFRNREHFKTAIYFHCGGLDLYPAAQ